MTRLTKPKAEYPVLVKKPVAKWFQKLYLQRIEGIYKKGSYEKYNLQTCVSFSLCSLALGALGLASFLIASTC